MKTSNFYSNGDAKSRNIARLDSELESLNDWRFRVHSTLLVASSAILVLSFSLPASEVCTSHIGYRLMILAGVLNALQILACIAVFGILLKFRIARACIYEREVQQVGEFAEYQYKHIHISLPRPMQIAYRASEIASFSLFAIVVLLLAVCRILSLA